MSDLSVSAIKTYRACPRRYRYQYVDRRIPIAVDDNLAFGLLGHRGLEAWWVAARDNAGDPSAWLEAALAALDGETDPYVRARAEAMLMGYHAMWSQQSLRVLDVEASFATPLVNPETGAQSRTWQLVGRVDALCEDERGRLLGVEHKTSSEDITPSSEYWQRLRLDQQVSLYVAAVGAEACLYDVLGKPAQRPLKATPEEARKYTKPTKSDPIPRLYANQRDRDETPEEYRARILAAIEENPGKYYVRGEVVRLEEARVEAARSTWQTGVQIRDARRLDLFPQHPDACHRYGRRCDYLGVCLGEESLTDPYRYKPKEEAQNGNSNSNTSDAA